VVKFTAGIPGFPITGPRTTIQQIILFYTRTREGNSITDSLYFVKPLSGSGKNKTTS